jgi:hypothetical protein
MLSVRKFLNNKYKVCTNVINKCNLEVTLVGNGLENEGTD